MSSDPLKALGQKIAQAQEKQHPSAPEEVPPTMGSGMRMGVELVAGVAVGAIFGYFLDKWLDTSPFLFILCFFLGAAAGFKNLIRAAQTDEKDQ